MFYKQSQIDIAADVVKERCVPAFDAKEVSLTSSIEIAFSSEVHIGTGIVTLVSTTFGADITIDVTDSNHCVLRDDAKSILLFGFSLLGSEKYQVTFPAGIVLSASGSKCGTVTDYFFETMSGMNILCFLIIQMRRSLIFSSLLLLCIVTTFLLTPSFVLLLVSL